VHTTATLATRTAEYVCTKTLGERLVDVAVGVGENVFSGVGEGEAGVAELFSSLGLAVGEV
jgi:hypothetical protein